MTVRADRIRKCWIDLATPGADLTAMPTLIDHNILPSEMLDKDGIYPAQDGGGDVDFSTDSAGTNRIALEVVNLTTDNDPSLATAELWIPVDYDSAGGNGVEVWYNSAATDSQPAASDPYGSQSVWASDYKLVSHDGGLNDSTQWAHNGTAHGGVTGGGAAGKIGVATDFDGSDDYFDLGDSGDFSFVGDVAATLSSWVYADSATKFRLLSKYTNGHPFEWQFDTGGAETLELWLFKDSTIKYIGQNDNSTLSTATWLHVVGVYDGSEAVAGIKLYINGSLLSTTVSDSGSYTGMENTTTPVYIGALLGSSAAYANGKIDETRIVKSIAKTADWISHEYANQNDPGTFGTAGTPENVSGTTITISDICSGADELSGLDVDLSVADTGAGSDADPAPAVLMAIYDIGSGSEAVSGLGVNFRVDDNVVAADVVAGVIAALSVSEVGSGADLIAARISALIEDSGLGADDISRIAKTVQKIISDSGLGADFISLGVSVEVSDTASAADAIACLLSAVRIADSGSYIDDIAVRFTVFAHGRVEAKITLKKPDVDMSVLGPGVSITVI